MAFIRDHVLTTDAMTKEFTRKGVEIQNSTVWAIHASCNTTTLDGAPLIIWIIFNKDPFRNAFENPQNYAETDGRHPYTNLIDTVRHWATLVNRDVVVSPQLYAFRHLTIHLGVNYTRLHTAKRISLLVCGYTSSHAIRSRRHIERLACSSSTCHVSFVRCKLSKSRPLMSSTVFAVSSSAKS